MKNTTQDLTHRQLKETQARLADVIKHAYMVIYVDGMVRAEKEDITFLDAITCELAERGLLTVANGILDFERFRAGHLTPREAAHEYVEAMPCEIR